MEVPLKVLEVLESPYREVTRPVVQYVKNLRRRSSHDVLSVYIPEYVVGRWWENILHNQSSLRLKGRLLFEQGVMVTSVPWQLSSISPPRPPARPAAARRPPPRRHHTGARLTRPDAPTQALRPWFCS